MGLIRPSIDAKSRAMLGELQKAIDQGRRDLEDAERFIHRKGAHQADLEFRKDYVGRKVDAFSDLKKTLADELEAVEEYLKELESEMDKMQ